MKPKKPDKVPANNIQKVVNAYLEVETNYALLVNGVRGIGKTHFLKNNVIPKIEKIKVQHDQRKYYKPIYISLFGLNSIDEVYYLFALELLPFLKNKAVKLTLGISKIFTRGFLGYNRLGNIDDYLKDISESSKNVLDTKEFVLVFDDLDRLSSKVTINEFIGFVNSMVEHDNNKVIIIADQGKIEDNTNYLAVKEKTIGTVIEYTSTFEQTFEEIIKGKYKDAGFQDYYKYLNFLKPDILEIFKTANSTNLRTLIYYLQHFSKLFHAMFYTLKMDQESPGELNLHKLRVINWFALSVTIEFKNGNLTYTDPNGIQLVEEINAIKHNDWLKEAFAENLNRLNNPNSKKDDENEPEKSFKEQFVAKYYEGANYYFYPSVFDFMTGGNEFNEEKLKTELKETIDDKQYNPTEQDLVYQKLSYQECYDLSNEKLISLSQKLLDFATAGEYPLDRYLSIFHYLIRFPFILNYDPKTIAEQLITAIDLQKEKFKYVPMLSHTFGVDKNDVNHAHFLTIFQATKKINDQIIEKEKDSAAVDLFKVMQEDLVAFIKKAQADYTDKSIFSLWDFKLFYDHFQEMKPTDIRMFASFLKNRYERYEFPDWFEKDFFTAFLDNLKTIDAAHLQTLKEYILSDLKEIIEQINLRVPVSEIM